MMADVTAPVKSWFCGKVLVDTRIRPAWTAGGAVAPVERNEVFDVSGDQSPSLGCRMGEHLILRERHQGGVGDNGDDVGRALIQRAAARSA